MRECLPLLTVALLGALAVAGCSDLSPIEANRCGNHVLDEGEHCDGEANCQPAGSDGQCHYACDPETLAAACPDGCDPLADCPGCCPGGFGCGVDQVCRQAAGTYSQAVSASAAPALALALSDLDADGRRDVVRLSTDTTSVHFYGDDLAPANTTVLWGAPSLPLPGDLTDDGLADLTQRMFLGGEDGGGLAVFRSQPDRSLLSTAYASISLKGSINARFAVIDVLPQAIPRELIAFRDRKIDGIQPGYALKPLMTDGGGDAADLVGIAVGNFTEDPGDSPCEEVAFAYSNTSAVRLLQPCNSLPTGGWLTSPAGLTDTTTITLPSGFEFGDIENASPSAAIGGAQALFPADWNDDGHLDLVIVAGGQSEPSMTIAYGAGDGHFHSTLPLPVPPEPYDNSAAELALVLEDECLDDQDNPIPLGFPLAVADFNGDNQLDIVTNNMLLMSTTGGTHSAQACNRRWSAAVAADFNGNGTMDLVTARLDGPSLDFFDGTGQGMFTQTALPTQRRVSQLAAGDFDGDLIADVVFAQSTADDDATDEVFVAFGRPAGSPELPEKVGEVDHIEQIRPGPIRASDAAWESLILSRLPDEPEDPLRAAIVVGNGHRGLHAPFILRQMIPGASMTEPMWITRGTFSVDEQAIAAMTRDDERGDRQYRIWLIRPTGNVQADMTASVAAGSAVEQTGLECQGCVPAAVDLGDDGIDELLTFDRSAVVVYEVVDDVSGFRLSSSHPTQILFGADDDAEGDARDLRARPIVADIDHDGRKDVALMAAGDVVILWNDGTPALAEAWANGDEAVVTRLEMQVGKDATDLALLQADGDLELELVVIGRRQSKLLQLVGSHAFEALSDVEPLNNWPSDKDLVRGGDVVAAGDLDGDGVDDLVIGDFSSFTVLRGQAVMP